MWAMCVSNDATTLAGHQRGRGFRPTATYDLTPGEQYPVLAMSITESVLLLMTVDDAQDPMFLPAGFFAPFSVPLPADWMFLLGTGIAARGREVWGDPIQALWGYPEMVLDKLHYTNLMEGDHEAVSIFDRRYAEALARPRSVG